MAFPIHDDNSQLRIVPWVTWGLIILNGLVFFLWELPQSPQRLQSSFFQYGAVPLEYTLRQDLYPYIPFPYWITLFTMMFIHGGFLHLFGNMLYLWIFGDNVEQAFGSFKFLLFYLFCGIGATLFYIYFNFHSSISSVGASGAISGVLAAYMILFPQQKIIMASFYGFFTIPAVVLIGIWVMIQLVSSLLALFAEAEQVGIAYMAHLGGFLIGLPIALILKFVRSRRDRSIG